MKLCNKLFVLTVIIALVLSLTACAGKKDPNNKKPNDSSNPSSSATDDTSKPTVSQPEVNNSDENKTEDNKTEDNKTEDNTPESKPEPVKKTPAELIVGKWTAKTDLSSYLIELGYEISEQMEITLNTEFTSGGSIIEKVDKNQMDSAMRIKFEQELNKSLAESGQTVQEFEAQIGMTLDDYIDNAIAELQIPYSVIGEYRFDGDTLFVKFEGDQEEAETTFRFIDDDTLKITTDSEETVYTRVK